MIGDFVGVVVVWICKISMNEGDVAKESTCGILSINVCKMPTR